MVTMQVNREAYDCIAWLLGFLRETIIDFDASDKFDMETRLMKAEALLYAIDEVENKL